MPRDKYYHIVDSVGAVLIHHVEAYECPRVGDILSVRLKAPGAIPGPADLPIFENYRVDSVRRELMEYRDDDRPGRKFGMENRVVVQVSRWYK